MKTRTRSRREFVGLTGAGIAGLASAPWLDRTAGAAQAAAASDTQDVDLVVFNAKVYTVDATMPRAEAFAVKAGRFVAVGTSQQMRALAGKGTRVIDAKGMEVGHALTFGPDAHIFVKAMNQATADAIRNIRLERSSSQPTAPTH